MTAPRAIAAAAAVLVAGALAACADDTDPPWQLDHDRVIAVRANPPGLAPGEQATLDALLARKGDTTRTAIPEGATVVSPASLADVPLDFDTLQPHAVVTSGDDDVAERVANRRGRAIERRDHRRLRQHPLAVRDLHIHRHRRPLSAAPPLRTTHRA